MADHIKDIILEYMKQADKKTQTMDMVRGLVGAILNEETQKQTEIVSVNQKEIVFGVGSSSVLYNFNLHKEEILKKIKENIKGVEKIRVKIQ